jgi:hypothetical protein
MPDAVLVIENNQNIAANLGDCLEDRRHTVGSPDTPSAAKPSSDHLAWAFCSMRNFEAFS